MELPPTEPVGADGTKTAGWWHEEGGGRLVCDVCPRGCHLEPDQRGFCFVRQNRDGRIVSTTYGRSTGFCIDPIEKKPLNHFYPGSAVLSFGTAGCNLGCKFCQNWTTTKSREVDQLCEEASPEAIAEAAKRLDCRSVAYTYNDPIVWLEYAIDTARACRAVGVKNVAVTSGYMLPAPRAAFYEWMDAANVDLKAFDDGFYRRLCLGQLEPVLDTLVWLVRETDVWLEITNLLIPGENDAPEGIERMCRWIAKELGPDVPLHFSAFHPDFKMTDRTSTPLPTLLAAHEIARRAGLHYVYTGNVIDVEHQTTYCPACQKAVIQRDGYRLGTVALRQDRCWHCGQRIAGRFDAQPGTWGGRRLPVRIADFAPVLHPGDTAMNPSDKTATGRPELTESQEQMIFRVAGARVATAVTLERLGGSETLSDELANQPLLGAFVSLKRGGQLRSCCGFMGASIPLAEAIDHAALRAATDDPRFPPISPSELEHLDMEVWLLWGLRPMAARGEDRVKEVEVGRHGLQVERGMARGLLLPAVAVEHGLDARGFLRQTCLKAQLPSDAWKEDSTRVSTFEGHAIRGRLADVLQRDRPILQSGGPLSADMTRLAEFCRQNLMTMFRGATPAPYLPGGFDGAVHGAMLTIALPGSGQTIESGKLSIRSAMPLQSTLFTLLEGLANGLRGRAERASLENAHLGLSVLWDPAMHGSSKAPDLSGVDPQRRAVVLLTPSGWSWAYDPDLTSDVLLEQAMSRTHLTGNASAQVLTLAIRSTEPRAAASNIVAPDEPRPPAVAGLFYPGNAREMTAMIDQMLPEAPARSHWTGAMVPHAGWIYSGRLAAAVLARIDFPKHVIVFAPKHNVPGADWAVAPHRRWLLPEGVVESDPELAAMIAGAVDGLELDAAAHRSEHAIEVQLPLLVRLAPQTRVVGVAMHGGDWPRLSRCAEQLAAAIETLPERPLLLISSDMNHFADDAETRRRDRLALAAIEALDPERLLETVRANAISMCGVAGTVVVMETLRRLGSLSSCESVGYMTSADTTGDTTRVVGYAGMLFA